MDMLGRSHCVAIRPLRTLLDVHYSQGMGPIRYDQPYPRMTDVPGEDEQTCQSGHPVGWLCTRAPQHAGNHEAGGYEGRKYAEWPAGGALDATASGPLAGYVVAPAGSHIVVVCGRHEGTAFSFTRPTATLEELVGLAEKHEAEHHYASKGER